MGAEVGWTGDQVHKKSGWVGGCTRAAAHTASADSREYSCSSSWPQLQRWHKDLGVGDSKTRSSTVACTHL